MGENAWRRVAGLMADIEISRKSKRKVLLSCVMVAFLYGLETEALIERQQQRLQVCGNNWVRRIVGVKRLDRRRMDELRERLVCR